jgi:hypothetical protein
LSFGKIEPIFLTEKKSTNCGYKSIFLDKKKALEALDPNIEVIGNPEMPRLSAFGKKKSRIILIKCRSNFGRWNSIMV